MSDARPRPSRRWRSGFALLASFLVYLLPLPGPHAAPLLGAWLVGALAREPGASLALASLGVALGAQGATFGVAWWILGRRVRALVLLLYVPILAMTTWWLTLALIPRLTLIDRDDAPENLSWPSACVVPGASLMSVPTSSRSPAGRPWIRSGPDAASYGWLGADCASRGPLAPPPGTMHSLIFASGSGATLETTWDVPAQRQRWWLRASPEADARELATPAPGDGVPILSDDGAWLISVERPAPPPETPRLVLRRVEAATSKVTDLGGLGLGAYAPLEASIAGSDDGISGEVLLSRNEGELIAIDPDGRVTWGPMRPEGIAAGSRTMRRVASGWVAWDAYVEDRAYAVSWDLPSGKGRHVVPRGRGLSSVDVDPSGRWLALSTSTVYSLGGVHDDVVVLELPSGAEVFRDSMPPYARSDVAFVAPGVLAYTAWDGRTAEVRVVHAPTTASPR